MRSIHLSAGRGRARRLTSSIGPRRTHHGMLFVVVSLVVVCACDSKSKPPAEIAECAEYADAVGACFGGAMRDDARRDLAPPADEASREALRASCARQLRRVRATCR